MAYFWLSYIYHEKNDTQTKQRAKRKSTIHTETNNGLFLAKFHIPWEKWHLIKQNKEWKENQHLTLLGRYSEKKNNKPQSPSRKQ